MQTYHISITYDMAYQLYVQYMYVSVPSTPVVHSYVGIGLHHTCTFFMCATPEIRFL